MRSRVEIAGHSAHQMLVAFPLGLLITSAVFDVIWLAAGLPGAATAAYWTLSAGLMGAAIAAPWGSIDWLHIPKGTRAKRVGAYHGAGNIVVVILFLAAWWLRTGEPQPPGLSLVFSFLAAALMLVTAWLGGELVSRLSVGVHEIAGLDAPSSLSEKGDARRARP